MTIENIILDPCSCYHNKDICIEYNAPVADFKANLNFIRSNLTV
jgi:hypothetical protein